MKKIIYSLILLVLVALSLQGEKIAIVPIFTKVAFKLDGIPNESFWKKVSPIDSFISYGKKDVKALAATRVQLCLDNKNLYIAVECNEPKKIVTNTAKNTSPWSADNIEIFIGSLEQFDWISQIVLSLNGNNYFEGIKKEDVHYAVKVNKNSWTSELVIPLNKLGKITNNTLLFNMFRSRYGKEMQSISNLRWAYEMDKYLKLKLQPQVESILYGPWSTQITQSSAVICWESIGKCQTTLSYREKGKNKITTIYADIYGNIADSSQKLHNVKLHNLKPGTTYEYFINDEFQGSFNTLTPSNNNFSFTTISDTHSRSWEIENLLQKPYAKKSDLFFHLGDVVSGIIGKHSFYKACISPIIKHWQKPFYIVRGNHEIRGNAPKVFMDMLYSNGQTYFSFLHKGVFFLILDAGDDTFNCQNLFFIDQLNYIRKVTSSSEFNNAQFRVLLTHYPLYVNKTPVLNQLFDLLPPSTKNAFDLSLSGHLHCSIKLLPNSNKIISNHPKFKDKKPLKVMPFIRLGLVNGNINVQKKNNTLTVKTYDITGKVLDNFVIKQKEK